MKSISKVSRHGGKMTECIGVCNATSQCATRRKMYDVNGVVVVRGLEAVQGALLLALPVGVVESSHAGLKVRALGFHT